MGEQCAPCALEVPPGGNFARRAGSATRCPRFTLVLARSRAGPRMYRWASSLQGYVVFLLELRGGGSRSPRQESDIDKQSRIDS